MSTNLIWKITRLGKESLRSYCKFQTPTEVTDKVMGQPTLEKQIEVLLQWIETIPEKMSRYNIIVDILDHLSEGWRFDYE